MGLHFTCTWLFNYYGLHLEFSEFFYLRLSIFFFFFKFHFSLNEFFLPIRRKNCSTEKGNSTGTIFVIFFQENVKFSKWHSASRLLKYPFPIGMPVLWIPGGLLRGIFFWLFGIPCLIIASLFIDLWTGKVFFGVV